MDRLLAAERGRTPAPIDMPGLMEEQVIQAAPEVIQEPDVEVEQVEPEEVEVEQVQVSQKDNDRERNLRVLREKAERADRAERERDEALRYIESLRQAKPVEVEEDIFSEDDFDDAKLAKVSTTVKKLRQEIKQLKQEQSQSSQASIEAKLRATYPDIEHVLTADNLRQLSSEFPELAESLDANPNSFTKASGAYKAIKKLGIYQDPNLYKADVQRVKTNAAKPRPLTSVSPQHGESPLTRANAFENGLTDELQKQLYREMIQSMKGV